MAQPHPDSRFLVPPTQRLQTKDKDRGVTVRKLDQMVQDTDDMGLKY
jgi:hypothetical protein